MNRDQPCTNQVDEMVQHISVRDAVDGGVGGEDEEDGVGDVSSPGRDTRDHLAAGQGLDEDEVWHYR